MTVCVCVCVTCTYKPHKHLPTRTHIHTLIQMRMYVSSRSQACWYVTNMFEMDEKPNYSGDIFNYFFLTVFLSGTGKLEKSLQCTIWWQRVAIELSPILFCSTWHEEYHKMTRKCGVFESKQTFFEKGSSQSLIISSSCNRYVCAYAKPFIYQTVNGFAPAPVQNQYVIQGMGGRCSVSEDATGVVRVVSSDASQPVNLYSVNHRLTSTWFVPLSLVGTWFVPLLVCDHSQGVYFPPKRRRSFSGFLPTNKQTNKQNMPLCVCLCACACQKRVMKWCQGSSVVRVVSIQGVRRDTRQHSEKQDKVFKES